MDMGTINMNCFIAGLAAEKYFSFKIGKILSPQVIKFAKTFLELKSGSFQLADTDDSKSNTMRIEAIEPTMNEMFNWFQDILTANKQQRSKSVLLHYFVDEQSVVLDITVLISVYSCSLLLDKRSGAVKVECFLQLSEIAHLLFEGTSKQTVTDSALSKSLAISVDQAEHFESSPSIRKFTDTEMQLYSMSLQLLLNSISKIASNDQATQDAISAMDKLAHFSTYCCQFLRHKVILSSSNSFKKAFANCCEYIVPSCLQAHNFRSSPAVNFLHDELCLLLECCLFNERTILDFSSIDSPLEVQSSRKAKNGNERGEDMGERKKLTNKSFCDALFATVAACYFNSGGNIYDPNSISILSDMFAKHSHHIEEQSRAVTERGSAPSETVSLSADWRKNIIRQFHFVLHFIDILWATVNGTVHSTLGAQVGSSKKRRRAPDADGQDSILIEGENDLSSSFLDELKNVSSLILFGKLRNSLLSTLQRTLSDQSLPKHSSLDRYVERLRSIGISNTNMVKALHLKIQLRSQNSNSESLQWLDVKQLMLGMYSLLDVELESILTVAAIDHTLLFGLKKARAKNVKKLIDLSLTGSYFVPSSAEPFSWNNWIDAVLSGRDRNRTSVTDFVIDGPSKSADIFEVVTGDIKTGTTVGGDFQSTLKSVWKQKLSLLGLILTVQSQLRSVDEVVVAFLDFEDSLTSLEYSDESYYRDIFASTYMTSLLKNAFSQILIGQIGSIWTLLVPKKQSSDDAPTFHPFGIIRCKLLRSLIRCADVHQRSEGSFISQDGATDNEQGTYSGAIFCNILNGLVCTLLSTLNSLDGKSESSGGKEFLTRCLLETIGDFLVDVTYISGTSSRQILNEQTEPLTFIDSDGEIVYKCTSLHSLIVDATLSAFESAVYPLSAKSYDAFLTVLLSMLFCISNIQALAEISSLNDEALHRCVQLLKSSLRIFVDLDEYVHKEVEMHRALQILLNNAIVWKPFANVESHYAVNSHTLFEKDLQPFFLNYFSDNENVYEIHKMETLKNLLVASFATVDVIDSPFIMHCVDRAIMTKVESDRNFCLSDLALKIVQTVPVPVIQRLSRKVILSFNNFVVSSLSSACEGKIEDNISAIEAAASIVVAFLSYDRNTGFEDFRLSIGRIDSDLSNSPDGTVDADDYFLFAARAIDLTEQYSDEEQKKSSLLSMLHSALSFKISFAVVSQFVDELQFLLNGVRRTVLSRRKKKHVVAFLRTVTESLSIEVHSINEESCQFISDHYLEMSTSLLEQLETNKVPSEADSSFLLLAECISAIQIVSNGIKDTAPYHRTILRVLNSLMTAMKSLAISPLTESVNQHSSIPPEGWLQIVSLLAYEILLRARTFCFIGDSKDTVRVNVHLLEAFLRAVAGNIIVTVRSSKTDGQIECFVIVRLLSAMRRTVLSARQCNVDLMDIFRAFNDCLLKSLMEHSSVDSLSTAVRRILRTLFVDILTDTVSDPSGVSSQDSLSSFLEAVVIANLKYCESQINVISERDVKVLYEMVVNLSATTEKISTLCRRGLSKTVGGKSGEGSNEECDSHSPMISHYQSWVSGLCCLLSVLSGKLQINNTVEGSEGYSQPKMMVDTTKSIIAILLTFEKVCQDSSQSMFAALSIPIGSICLTLCRLLECLIGLDSIISSAKGDSKAVTFVKEGSESIMNLVILGYQVYGRVLTCLSLSKSASSHAPFISAALVDRLAASPIIVSRALQESVYPGIFSLLERCDSKQKKQMFGILSAAPRALMMDLNEKFVQTFKFLGK